MNKSLLLPSEYPYAFYFDETTSSNFVANTQFTRDDEIGLGLKVLRAHQDFENAKFRTYGEFGEKLLLREVLKDIGFDKPGIPIYDTDGHISGFDTDTPNMFGWEYDSEGTCYVDLGATVVYRRNENGKQMKTILCCPNVKRLYEKYDNQRICSLPEEEEKS